MCSEICKRKMWIVKIHAKTQFSSGPVWSVIFQCAWCWFRFCQTTMQLPFRCLVMLLAWKHFCKSSFICRNHSHFKLQWSNNIPIKFYCVSSCIDIMELWIAFWLSLAFCIVIINNMLCLLSTVKFTRWVTFITSQFTLIAKKHSAHFLCD